MEDDARFEWLSPDERTRLPFQRARRAALGLAAQWDLCCSGDGLHHLHQIGADASYVPLTQARTGLVPPAWPPLQYRLRAGGGALCLCAPVLLALAMLSSQACHPCKHVQPWQSGCGMPLCGFPVGTCMHAQLDGAWMLM